MLAVSGSDHVVKLYNRSTMTLAGQLRKHTANIVGLAFSNTDPHVLWTCAQDKVVNVWDVRADGPQKAYRIHKGLTPSAFDINCNDSHFAVGTEQSGDDSHVLVYDVRQDKPMLDFSDAHCDDITQVRFHPNRPSVFTSGATDGLVNVYDIAVEAEEVDDLIGQTLNSESSVSRLGFFGPNHECVYCLTHTETLLLWHLLPNADDETPELISKYANIRDAMVAAGPQVDYLVDCKFDGNTQRLYLIGGSFTGAIEIMHLNIADVSPVLSLVGGHNDIVRCVDWNLQGQDLVSGDESAFLSQWTAGEPPTTPLPSPPLKMSVEHHRRSEARRSGKPY